MWRVEFTTDRFLPRLPEQCQTNPGAYGFELALWLAQRLLDRGIVTSYPQSEDWGWLIEFTDDDETEIRIGCSSMAAEGEGYEGKPIGWSVFVKPHVSLRERLRGVTHLEKVNRLGSAIVELLESEGVPSRPASE